MATLPLREIAIWRNFARANGILESPERVAEMGFALTSVAWRKEDLKKRLAKSARLIRGEEKVTVDCTGEEGVNQIRALLGLTELITNVNLPNRGQIPNLPIGAVVETNAVFRANSLRPVFAGVVPETILPLISRVCTEQEAVSAAIAERDGVKIFAAFVNDPLVTCGLENARQLFLQMCRNTAPYLQMYPFMTQQANV